MPESPSMEREEWSHLPIIDGKVGEGVKFERIRRITGYLVGTVERFNNAKRAEVRDRVKHMVFPTHVGCFLKPYSPPAPLLPCSRPYPAKTAERATPANAGFGKALSNHPATGNPPRRSCGKSGAWAAWLQALPVPAFRAGVEASLPVWAARRALSPLRPAPHVGR